MRFTWDQQKNETNFLRRGFDFEFAILAFRGPILEREDKRRDYGERRMVALGVVEQDYLTVVYTDRLGSAGDIERRIISARRSNRRERNAYDEEYEEKAEPGQS